LTVKNDDIEDMRLYVGSILTKQYRLIEAGDGQAALELARKRWPDLIVSDVMMDGLELCRILKTDENTSHIPVILL